MRVQVQKCVWSDGGYYLRLHKNVCECVYMCVRVQVSRYVYICVVVYVR